MFFAGSETTLASRLTLWYGIVFSLSSVAAFGIMYILISGILEQQTLDDLEEDIEELSLAYTRSGLASMWQDIDQEIASDGADQAFYRLLDTQGNIVRSTDMRPWENLPQQFISVSNTPIMEMQSQKIRSELFESDIQIAYATIADNLILQIGISLEGNSDFLEVIRKSFLNSVPIVILLATVIGWFMARKALSGVEQVTSTAKQIAGGHFHQRVPYQDNGREINELASTFNGMLDKIQKLLQGMREMTDNVAHDLRSPLTHIRGEAETLLTSKDTLSDEMYRQVLATTIEESDRLLNMINTMLDITETEAGLIPTNTTSVDFSSLVDDACDLFQPLAAQNHIDFSFDTEKNLTIPGNASFLQRLITNLIDNALKYTPEGGMVRVSLHKARDKIMLQVQDTGIGIDEHEQTKIFNRFYRGDRSRTKAGNGLGLCLAQAIARAHLGEITVDTTLPKGSIFTVSFIAQ